MWGWEGSVSLLPQRNSIEPHWCTALDTQKQSGQSPLRNYTRFKLSLLRKDLITFSFFNGESLLLVFCLHKSVSVEQALLCALHALLCAVSATWRFLDASFRSVKKKNQSKRMQKSMNKDMWWTAWGQRIHRAFLSPQMSQPNSALVGWACPVPPHAALKGNVSETRGLTQL